MVLVRAFAAFAADGAGGDAGALHGRAGRRTGHVQQHRAVHVHGHLLGPAVRGAAAIAAVIAVVGRRGAVAAYALRVDAKDRGAVEDLPIAVGLALVRHLHGAAGARIAVVVAAHAAHGIRVDGSSVGIGAQPRGAAAQVDGAGVADGDRAGVAAIAAHLVAVFQRRIVLVAAGPAQGPRVDAVQALARRGQGTGHRQVAGIGYGHVLAQSAVSAVRVVVVVGGVADAAGRDCHDQAVEIAERRAVERDVARAGYGNVAAVSCRAFVHAVAAARYGRDHAHRVQPGLVLVGVVVARGRDRHVRSVLAVLFVVMVYAAVALADGLGAWVVAGRHVQGGAACACIAGLCAARYAPGAGAQRGRDGQPQRVLPQQGKRQTGAVRRA
ncbi:hypothetical protein ACAE110713_16910 [Achromobacter aegrifaciens]